MGARPLRREIQRRIENPLSEKILMKEFHAGETVLVDVIDRIGEDGNPVPNEKDITFKGMPTISKVEDAQAVEGDDLNDPSSVAGISGAAKSKPKQSPGSASAPAAE